MTAYRSPSTKHVPRRRKGGWSRAELKKHGRLRRPATIGPATTAPGPTGRATRRPAGPVVGGRADAPDGARHDATTHATFPPQITRSDQVSPRICRLSFPGMRDCVFASLVSVAKHMHLCEACQFSNKTWGKFATDVGILQVFGGDFRRDFTKLSADEPCRRHEVLRGCFTASARLERYR
jgi:hypothetical protein